MTERMYQCRKCGKLNKPWQAFETGWPKRVRYWCLHHIPLRVRVKMRVKELLGLDDE